MTDAHVEMVLDAPASQVAAAITRMRRTPAPLADRLLLLAAGRMRPGRVTAGVDAVSHTRSMLHLRGADALGLRLLGRHLERRARRYLHFGVRTGAATVPLRAAAATAAPGPARARRRSGP